MSPMSSNSNSGPPSPLQAQFAAPPGSSNNMLATPQLFWTQRRILGTNPFPRFMHTSSITANGTDIYLYGGNQRGTPNGDLFIVDSGKCCFPKCIGRCIVLNVLCTHTHTLAFTWDGMVVLWL